jgi:UDP-GlcNAc:undecaprenyl-phosphate/decaprenyl-phosphate GlcNAc-1-phosphate transferase
LSIGITYVFGLFMLISLISVRVGMAVMGHFGILDQPGGHKQHTIATPFVGGFGVFAALIVTLHFSRAFFPEVPPHILWALTIGGALIFATGLADDVWRISFRVRLAIQTLVALIMVFLGGIELHSLGAIVVDSDLLLGWLSLPFTVFATVGLINALNMIDGIDGISGTLSFISLACIAFLAGRVDDGAYLVLCVAIMGGIAGFLAFNLRYPTNRRARVFLGDNGSMLLGFVFAWLLIALSQDEQRAMTPVTALWLLAVPLMDTVRVTLRRIWTGSSPFRADRNHLHHLFIRAGFRVSDTVWIVSCVHFALAAVGIAGFLLGLPEKLMFALFLASFAAYFALTAYPQRFVLGLRRINFALGLPSVFAHGVFVGYFEKTVSREVVETLKSELIDLDGFRLSLHRISARALGARNIYGIVEIECHDDEESIARIHRLMTHLKARLAHHSGVRVHLLLQRSKENDRRDRPATDTGGAQPQCQRKADRREELCHPAMYSAIGHKDRAPRTIVPLIESTHSAI